MTSAMISRMLFQWVFFREVRAMRGRGGATRGGRGRGGARGGRGRGRGGSRTDKQ